MARSWVGRLAVTAVLLILPSAARSQVAAGTINTVAGGGPNNVAGTSSNFAFLYQSAPDASGNLFFPDVLRCGVFKLNPGGVVTLIAGELDVCGFGGDGGPALSAQLNGPGAVGLDALGNVFIADSLNQRVRRVDHATGVITTVAGTGVNGFGGDGGPATSAMLSLNPVGSTAFFDDGVVMDASGNLFIADSFNNRVRRVDAAGNISTVAGTGVNGLSGDGGQGTAAALSSPRGLVIAPSGVLLIDDFGNNRIRTLDPTTGIINTIAGTTNGFSGDGGPAIRAQLNGNEGVGVDGAGNVYIADRFNNRIREVFCVAGGAASCTPPAGFVAGDITTVAGNGTAGFMGDGGAALSGEINAPVGVSADAAGNFFIADTNNVRIRRVDATTKNIATLVGNGFQFYSGNGVAGPDAGLNIPTGMVADGAGNIVFADSNNFVVRLLDAGTGNITTIAGTPNVSSFSGDNGPATSAAFVLPFAVAIDPFGNIFVADRGDSRIRRIDATTGNITTFAGNGTAGFMGDNGAATMAELNHPIGVASDTAGNIFIADFANNRIRRVGAASGVITTVAGNGTAAFGGDGGAATSASLNRPEGATLDASGNLFIADRANARIRRVDAMSQVITTVAGNGTTGSGGDGGVATSAQLARPAFVALDTAGDLFIVDFINQSVRRVDVSTQIITTVAGNGTQGFSGDGGPATSAQLNQPEGVVVDSTGNIFVSDTFNSRIRKVIGAAGAIFGLSPGAIAYGTTQKGLPAFQVITVSNTTASAISYTSMTITGPNAADISFSAVAVNGCVVTGGTLGAGANCLLNMAFTASTLGAEAGGVIIKLTGGVQQTVPITGTGGQSVVTFAPPAGVQFGNVNANRGTATLTVTFTISGTLNLSVNRTQITGPNMNDFRITNDRCSDSSFSPRAMCTVDVTFTPSMLGTETATLALIGSQTPSPTNVPLMGTGVQAMASFAPDPLQFGNVNANSGNSTLTLIVTNTGTAQMNIAAGVITGPNAGDFKVVSDGCFDNTENPMRTCTIRVTFTPTTVGPETATLPLKGNQVPSPTNVSLMGTGVSPNAGFTLTPAPGTGTQVTVVPGNTAQFTIMVTPAAGSSGPVMFGCTETPITITIICTVTPSSGTLNGATPITLVITFKTNCLSALPPRGPVDLPPTVPPHVFMLWMLSLLGLGAVRRFAPETRLARVAPAVVMLMLTMSWAGCSATSVANVQGAPTTPLGLYTITITGTSGAVQQSIGLIVRVI